MADGCGESRPPSDAVTEPPASVNHRQSLEGSAEPSPYASPLWLPGAPFAEGEAALGQAMRPEDTIDAVAATLDDAAIAAALQAEELGIPSCVAMEEVMEAGFAEASNLAASNLAASEDLRAKRRRLVRHVVLVSCLCFLLLGVVGGAVTYALLQDGAGRTVPVDDGPPTWLRTEMQNVSRAAHDLSNAYRARRGLPMLRWHQGLADIGEAHAQSIVDGLANFTHAGFEDRVHQYPFSSSKAAENLSMCRGRDDVAKCSVDGWIDSPPHEKNLADASFDLCGIGAAVDPEGRHYLTQLFASI